MQLFLGEEILLPHYVLDYKIDFPFPEHRLAIEADEFDHIGRTSDNEREEEIKEYHECKFIRIELNLMEMIKMSMLNLVE